MVATAVNPDALTTHMAIEVLLTILMVCIAE